MPEKVEELWKLFVDKHTKVHPKDFAQLHPSATDADFAKFRAETNLEFPSALEPIYRMNNGQGEGMGLFFGLEFLSLDGIIKQWKSWAEIHAQELDGTLENMAQFSTSYPPKSIKIAYTNTKWLPFSYDYAGNYLGVDLDPDVAGTSGQIINFGRDEEAKIVFAVSFQLFLELCLSVFETENLYKTIESTHFIDYLKKRVKEKKQI